MREKGIVYLIIKGQNLKLEQISKELSQQPYITHRKGDTYIPEFGDKQPEIYEEDYWSFKITKHENETIDATVYRFLTKFKKSKEYLNKLSKKADLTLWVCVYTYDKQSMICLEKKTLKLLADFGLIVDFDIMFIDDSMFINDISDEEFNKLLMNE